MHIQTLQRRMYDACRPQMQQDCQAGGCCTASSRSFSVEETASA
ncbi:MAG: hypothetical protein PHZ00_05560 [Candidatus Peribacteraceae bacterium]|nr:hypothetical protein [Candidatus Peribacteraceae bacterium]